MAAPLELYEHKILSDREFPVQLFLNRFHEKGWYFKEHWHEHLELHYVLEGEALFRLNKTDIYARKGDLVIANSNVLHGGYCDGSIKVLVLIFEMSALAGELADLKHYFSFSGESGCKYRGDYDGNLSGISEQESGLSACL